MENKENTLDFNLEDILREFSDNPKPAQPEEAERLRKCWESLSSEAVKAVGKIGSGS